MTSDCLAREPDIIGKIVIGTDGQMNLQRSNPRPAAGKSTPELSVNLHAYLAGNMIVLEVLEFGRYSKGAGSTVSPDKVADPELSFGNMQGTRAINIRGHDTNSDTT